MVRSTDRPAMTIAVDLGQKARKTNKQLTILFSRGVKSYFCFQKLGRDGAVPLSNSLSLADRHRMNHLVKQNNTKDVTEYCPFKYGESHSIPNFVKVFPSIYRFLKLFTNLLLIL